LQKTAKGTKTGIELKVGVDLEQWQEKKKKKTLRVCEWDNEKKGNVGQARKKP